ncbi:SMP-30/gluconolactonase/LRE family protein [Foetidibacter luteolus]|uniref:SMP-30/gluconolactonase/LRE family protein n=1 Tax=Foetidibacter luteolus TaxID=2608880 RepID=UPI00129B5893|nr:SMP-30/gluconolactonase/LRE family protein [Foetidibacter luteolus]
MKSITIFLFSVGLYTLTASCGNNANTAGGPEPAPDSTQQPSAATRVQVLDEEALQFLDSSTAVEVLAGGFKWTEGPLYISDGNYLLFSDIPNNRICKWKEGDSISTYLQPSGNTMGAIKEREPGSNGLLLDAKGNLVLCQHGDRRIARMTAPISSPAPQFVTLADSYEGKRLNSPNDAVFHPNGDLYFTDPPYGLDKILEDTAKQLSFQGVYRLKPGGKPELLVKDLKFPNGIALSPDGKYLYIGSSDGDNPVWMRYELGPDGLVKNGQVFCDIAAYDGKGAGGADGLKVNKKGYLFASGPKGLWIINPSGKVIARIYTGQATSNCGFSPDEKQLFITCDDYLMRVKLK